MNIQFFDSPSGYLFMLELEPPKPVKKEHLFRPTDPVLIVKKGRHITQELGWTRCHRVVDDKDNEVLWLKGLGLKTAEYQPDETNIYCMYSPSDTETPAYQFDAVVKENMNDKSLWDPYRAMWDPLLRNNMYFAEKFCNPTIETSDPEEPTN